MSKCIGCGITLQNNNSTSLGYTKNLDNKYCERCFKTIHYNEEKKVDNIDNNKIIDKINKMGYLTLFITDLLSINNELINVFKSINNKKVLVINKCDIIPDNLKLEHIEENIKKVFNIWDDVYFISAKKEYNLNKIIRLIEDNKNVILCGETSSGKSTLINQLVGSNLTTSKYNNTTLDFIKIKYLDYVIYDTPGIIIKDNKKSIERIRIKPLSLNNDYILNIDDYIIRCNGNVTLLVNDDVIVNTKKSDILLNNKITINNASDIELDKGFIYIKSPCVIEVNKKVRVRKSIISK